MAAPVVVLLLVSGGGNQRSAGIANNTARALNASHSPRQSSH